MTYFVSLKMVALWVGLLHVAAGLGLALLPAARREALPALPRHRALGTFLMLVAGVWTLWLLNGQIDLGEFSDKRPYLLAGTAALCLGIIAFVPEFLVSRGLGLLLLLGADVLVSAAFPEATPLRLVVTTLGYVWAVIGMVLVASPYRLRDWLGVLSRGAGRWRTACTAGAALGAVLVGLAITVY